MGVLSATGAASVTADAGAGGDAVGAELEGAPVEEGGQEGGEPAEVSTEPGQTDAPARPESRRQRAARELAESVSRTLETKFAQERDADRQRYSALEQRAAWLQGQLETMQRQPAQGQQQQQQGPDPDALEEQAQARLDANDFAGYQKLSRQAATVRAEQIADARVRAALEQVQRQMPQAQNPFINTMLARHQNVAMAGARGEMAVQTKLNELKIMTNHPDHLPVTPEMMAKAFELADGWLASVNKPAARAAFSQDASAVSGPSTTRNGSNGAGAGAGDSQLTAAEKAAMTAGGFKNEAEYIKWRDPSKFVKKW